MTQAKSQRSGARTPRGIRRALLEVTLRADKTQGRSTPGDPVRDAAQKLARSAPSSLDKFWRRAREHGGGPIDVIDMFSGCGGMSAGFLAANAVVPAYRLIAAVDIDRVANKTYEKNLGVRPYDDDVSDLARDDARIRTLFGPAPKRRRRPLVLIGCAPCQGFSSHRNSKGKRDQRNSLFSDFARIAAKLLPEAVVIENVPELLTTRYWSHVEEARNILEECGYHVHLGVHNMAEYGLPQERFRALMIAMRKPFVPVRGFLVRSRFRTVRSAIGNLPAVRAGEKHPKDDMHYSAGHRESTLSTIRAVAKDGGSRPEHVGPDCLRRIASRQGKQAYEDIYGRLYWDRPAVTITAYARNPASGRFVHPEQDRGLTVREAALLQGFPGDFWFSGSFDERFRQIGNAVPPTFAAHLALHILGELVADKSCSTAGRGIENPVGVSFSRLIPALKAGTRDLASLGLM